MPIDVTFRIGGQAGQGMQVISYTLGKTFTRGGYYVFGRQDVMSRIRGGHNFADVRVSDRSAYAHHEQCNVLIALDQRTIAEHQHDMVPGGVIVYDPKAGKPEKDKRGLFAVPLNETATRVGKDIRMTNSVAVGAVLSLTGYPLEPLLAVLKEQFSAKGSDVVKSNVACARAGYEFADKTFGRRCPCQLPALHRPVSRFFLSGAEAVGLSAILSGLQFYSGYPMSLAASSPSTPILEYLAARGREHGILVLQTEDEVSAINMAIGASVTGARAMTASSGGGFSLMVEGLSLAGMTETPLVIALCSRPGPGTGLATRQAQADLLFARHAGHGEFDRIILSPGTAEETFYLTNQAFDLAEKYQVPAILLLDQHINDSFWTADRLDESRLVRERYLADPSGMAPYTYKRYALPSVSPLVRPGTANQVRYDDSDEHTEEGHITESAEIRRAMVQKRLGKAKLIASELARPECVPGERTKAVVLTFGSTYGAAREAVTRLREQGASVGMMHLSVLAPFPRESVLAQLAKTPRIITVENNATAQLARLVTTETRLKVYETVLKYDGRPFAVEEVASELERLL
jgi:2-oxoglutarate ferredoxin oxidoreductase subunit alpha